MATNILAGKKILFANFPASGHFNPLTGLAVYLKEAGCDVRWYTSRTFTDKLHKLNIMHYPFKRAIDVADNDFDTAFPGRLKHKTQIGRLKFDIIHSFILRAPEYYEDLQEIYKEFPFELMIADCAFTAIPFVKDLMHIPVVAIGVLPLSENSKDLPPSGLGMIPSYTWAGQIKQQLLRWITKQVIFRKPDQVLHELFNTYNIAHHNKSIFDILSHKADILLQIGAPGFEYYRSDLGNHVRFIGALLPYASAKKQDQWFDSRLNRYSKIILVTQGTVEKEVTKILIPTLEAFKDSDTLVIATTGGSQTNELRLKYPHDNIIIEDFIPFQDVMPYTDVYITNGGYGGVMLSIENNLPMVVAGLHEGKNEICARVGYFNLGINLKTETPSPAKLKKAVETVISQETYKAGIMKMGEELRQYQPLTICADHIAALMPSKPRGFNINDKKTVGFY
ncbi:MAG: glycosyltransferase [Agriterribacter sp.]